jgi:hypothetical protein
LYFFTPSPLALDTLQNQFLTKLRFFRRFISPLKKRPELPTLSAASPAVELALLQEPNSIKGLSCREELLVCFAFFFPLFLLCVACASDEATLGFLSFWLGLGSSLFVLPFPFAGCFVYYSLPGFHHHSDERS